MEATGEIQVDPHGVSSTIPRLVETVKDERQEANEPSGNKDQSTYIKEQLIPKLESMHWESKEKIEAETNPFEKVRLKEKRFVETVKLFTHPEIRQRIEKIISKVNGESDQPIEVGLTIVGSAALGGLLVREAVGTADGSWVDVDLIGSYILEEEAEDFSVYSHMSGNVLPEIKSLLNSDEVKSEGTSDYQLCDAHSIKTMAFPVLLSAETAQEVLNEYTDHNTDGSSVLYNFFPSYPDHHNGLNRYFLLSALQNIADKDPAQWSKIHTKLITSFKNNIQPFKAKYFGKDDHSPIQNDLATANHYFAMLFEDLISETGAEIGITD